MILEDPTNDQYVVKPICEKLFADLGRRVRIDLYPKGRVTGVDRALESGPLSEILDTWSMSDLFLLVIDRDGREGDRTGNTERARAREREHAGKLLVCLAIEEIEVWLLALHRDELEGARWPAVRAHEDPKEAYFDPLMVRKNWSAEVGGGRMKAMRELGAKWRGLLGVCEELKEFKDRIEDWLSHRPA